MYPKIFKLLTLYLLVLLIFSYVVNSVEDYEDYSEDRNESHDNVTQSVPKHNTTEEFDYNEFDGNEDNEDSCNSRSFVDKVKTLHEEGRNRTFSKYVNNINETFEILMKARKSLGSLFGIEERERLKLFELISEIDLGLSTGCLSSFMRVMNGISGTDLWALKFMDSLGSFPPKGFTEGVLADFGEYEECLDIESPQIPNDKSPIIKGQYCMLKVILPFPAKDKDIGDQNIELAKKFGKDLQQFSTKGLVETLNIVNGTIYQLGICIPSQCSAHEIENMINKILFPITGLPVEINRKCNIKDQPIVLDNFQVTSFTIFIILIILVIVSTSIEIYVKYTEALNPDLIKKDINELWFSFSIIKNTKSLFAETNTKWQSLDTIRLFIIIYVHVVHIYLSTVTLGMVTLKKLFTRILPRMWNDGRYFFTRNPLMIDALYTLSGFLTSNGLLKKLEQTSGRFNYPMFILQNWVRFMLLAFGSILFFYIFPLFGSGPVWESGVTYATYGCKNPYMLLRIFFFVNNFHEFSFETFHHTCNLPIWFLSALLQYLMIAPIFIILYYKNPKLGKYVMICALIVTTFISVAPKLLFGVKTYLEILVHGTKLLSRNVSESINWFHTYPNSSIMSFFVGMAFGFLMRHKIKLNRKVIINFWILSVLAIIAVYVWQNSFWKTGGKEPVVSAILWHTLGKFAFCSSMGWIYYALSSGKGGFISDILSWPGFRPISRLSFGIFMLHYLVVAHRIFNVKEVFIGDDMLMWRHITVDLIFDVLLAYIFYILIECPFTNIFKAIFSRRHVEPELISSKL